MMQVEAKSKVSGLSSDPTRTHNFWIWRAVVPNKIIVFMWQTLLRRTRDPEFGLKIVLHFSFQL